MDYPQQRQVTSNPGPVHPVTHKPPSVSVLGEITKQPSKVIGTSANVTPGTQSGQPDTVLTSPPLATISRPRPTALRTKSAPKSTRIPVEPSLELDLIPVCIPRPKSTSTLDNSPSESTFPHHSPHSPQSPLSSHPHLSPTSSLWPPQPTSLSPQPQRNESQAVAEKTAGENDEFRLQEVNSMINKRLKDALFSDQWSERCMDTLSPFGYVLVASQRMQGVLLLIFSRFCHLPFLRGVQTQSTRTGLGGYWGNKGGVSARMTVFGHSVCFLNCHLPAHMQNLEQRMEDFESILQQQQFEGGAVTGVLDHDVVFWFGDLNFRIEDYDIHVVKGAIDSNKLPLLWERDQLNMAKNAQSILDGFTEGPLKFPPTYKFDVGTHTYDTSSKKRKPAWTDRILWRLRRTGSPVPTHNATLQRGLTSWLGGTTKVTQHVYRSHMGFTISDHKPVSALFSLHFPFRVNTPLVELQVNKVWCKVLDATVRFTTASNYQRSSWDWIAIYKVGFRHHKDYQAYVWARGENAAQVTFAAEDLPRDDCDFILGYYSNNLNSIVGLSSPIQIKIPVHSPTVCHSDSSEISSEDDSTLVLLAPNSRSPSPKIDKHRHRHRRSRSPAVSTLSSNPLPSLQGLHLCPRSKESHTQNRSPNMASKKELLVSPDSAPSPSISPLSPRSPASPGSVSAPEALIAAILGEHRPAQVCLSGVKQHVKQGGTCVVKNVNIRS
ncbi:phosphatidylinositol 4,5-bisphosphate 5-phosphatase A isoform X2 [Gouania willdenowi]|uniref:phosphatidylinositol 4,5-bisphosphate 5-phosphatase A isoform X2 n=1 Tax=Gouania willdenowi TaxID=441366 RepID=UPI001054BA76|nr:phosphatidylinositol 4,5-bisphosphate 5-phosphatase A-like isoform X2 [Gouania willdenowi]